MSRITLIVLVALAAFCASGMAHNCKRRCASELEVWNDCASPCERSCEELEPRLCTLPCKRGCVCQDGYVRGPDRTCVLPEECESAYVGIHV